MEDPRILGGLFLHESQGRICLMGVRMRYRDET